MRCWTTTRPPIDNWAMFTGIIERPAEVIEVTDHPGCRRLTIASLWTTAPSADAVRLGESIAVAGVCLTVAGLGDGRVSFDVIAETLDKTALGTLTAGRKVNVERAMRIDGRIDGHFVQGHIDGTGVVLDNWERAGEWRLRIAPPAELIDYLTPKGSITIDGVSLTLARVDCEFFEVALIPTTLGLTTLGALSPGDRVNLEADVISKTVVNFMRLRGGAS